MGRPSSGSAPSRPEGSSMAGLAPLMNQFANPALPLDGMSGTLTLVTNIQEDVLVVPNNAIARVGRDNTVKIKNSDGTTELRVVQTGNDDGSNTVIINGLQENEIILIEMKNYTTDSKNSDAKPTPSGGRPSGSFGGPR